MAISPLSLIIFGDYEGRNAHFSPHDLKNHKQQQIVTKKNTQPPDATSNE